MSNIDNASHSSGTSLAGMTAVVTGGTTGIGRATARLFHAAGASVIVTGNNPATIAEARRELPEAIEIVQANARSLEDTARLAKRVEERFGTLDILFLNAGIAGLMPLDAISEAFYDEHMDVNVKGVIFTLQRLLPQLRGGSSVIVNTSVADQRGVAMMSVYAATKGAIAAFVRSVAVELASRAIRVNAIAPATIRTPIQGKFGLPPEAMAEVEATFTRRIPLGRYGEPEEVANLALFLASRASSYITGTEMAVDGGLLVA